MEVWKQFDRNLVSHSAAHHLTAIQLLIDRHGYARVSDVARFLEITRGSVSITVRKLKDRELIREDENRFLLLTPRGSRLARSILARQQVLQTFFQDILGIEPELAGVDSCKLEHLVSAPTSSRLMELIGFLRDDPDGQRVLERFRQARATGPRPGDDAAADDDPHLLESL